MHNNIYIGLLYLQMFYVVVSLWVVFDLGDPMDCSPPGSSAHGIFHARILEWDTIFSPGDLPDPGIEHASPALTGGFFTISSTWEALNIFMWKWKCYLLSCVQLFVTLWTVVCQDPISMELSRQEYWKDIYILFSKGSSWPSDQTQVSVITGRLIFTIWPTRKMRD